MAPAPPLTRGAEKRENRSEGAPGQAQGLLARTLAFRTAHQGQEGMMETEVPWVYENSGS